jgi:hypothetical protein
VGDRDIIGEILNLSTLFSQVSHAIASANHSGNDPSLVVGIYVTDPINGGGNLGCVSIHEWLNVLGS